MDTDGSSTRAVRSGAARRTPDPQMSAAEKCMAEWEARHDVAARGHRGSPEALQHYFARSRLAQPARPHAAAGHAAPAPAAAGRAAEERPAPAPGAQRPPDRSRPRSGTLLARLLRRSG